MLKRALTLSMIAVLAFPMPARAASTIEMDDSFTFSPASKTVLVRGTANQRTIIWQNESTGTTHNTVRRGVIPWHSGFMGSDADFQKIFKYAGGFAYGCTIHESQDMDGTIRVKPFAGLGGENTVEVDETARVIVGAEAPPSGVVFDIQRKVGGEWRSWKTGITKRSVSFTPHSKGDRYFRARVRKPSISSKSAWSPVATLHVVA